MGVVTVEVTGAEVESGTLSPAHLSEAVAAVRRDGLVVLKDVVDLEHVAVLRERLIEDLAALQAREDAPYNFNTGNIQQDPPPVPPYLFRDVLMNEQGIAVTRALLGPGVTNAFYSGNTALPSKERQPVHADLGQLWVDLEVAPPPYGLVVNVPLVDVSPENGSTEIWPGTHRDTSVSIATDIKVTPEALEVWRQRVSPIQPTVSAGSMLIRDIRLWHAGMPNRTSTPRPMIAMIHYAGWYNPGPPLRFPKGTESLLSHPELRQNAVFVEGPIDHIAGPHAYEYGSEDR